MDHEYSTGGLGPQLVGWDWFSLQLDDGREVMLYQLRRQDDSSDPFSSGTLIAPDDRTTCSSVAVEVGKVFPGAAFEKLFLRAFWAYNTT